MEDIEMPDGQRMKQIEESGYKYLRIIQDSEIKIHVIKDKITTEYLKRVRKLAKLELHTRNALTCKGLFRPRANVAGLYLKRSEEGRVLISAKDCILSECNGLWDYLDKSEEPLLKEVGSDDFIMEKEGRKEYDRRTMKRNENDWKEKAVS